MQLVNRVYGTKSRGDIANGGRIAHNEFQMKDSNGSKLLIGLGNPGIKYVRNRHNVGQMFIDSLPTTDYSLPPDTKLLKTDCFMNDSGKFVKKKITDYRLPATDVFIVHDDLDIPLGKFKIQFGVGPKVHNGLDSVEEHLGTKDFWRIRIGVDNRDPEKRMAGEQYVLQDFTHEEMAMLDSLFPKIWEVLDKQTLKVN